MRIRRCPLCDAPLESHTCPKCANAAVMTGPGTSDLERTLRDPRRPQHVPDPEGPLGLTPKKERAAWYAAAGEAAPRRSGAEEGEELAVERHEGQRGFGAAAAILLGQAVSGLLVLGFGGFPDLLDVGVQVVVAAALLSGIGPARFGILVAAVLHLIKVGMMLRTTGSPSVLLSAAPSICLLGAFHFRPLLLRGLSSALGVALAFAWLGMQAVVASQPAGALGDFALAQGEHSEPSEGWTLRVPGGVTLYDGTRMRQAVRERRAELLGAQLKEELARRGNRERLLFSNPDGSSTGGLIADRMPPTVDTGTLLSTLALLGEGAERVDALVPPGIAESPGLVSQGWRSPEAGGTRDVLLVRAPDGRAVVVHCLHPAGAGERLCREVFHGLAVKTNP